MSIPFNPQRPRDSALNAVMLGAMGTGKAKIIIDFETGGDQVFVNGQGVPGFENDIKAYKSGEAKIEQLNGKGKISSSVDSEGAFFTLEKNLLTLREDNTYKIEYTINLTSFFDIISRYVWWVRGIKTIVSAGMSFPSNMILLLQVFRNADNTLRVFFHYRATNGVLTQLAIFNPATPALGQDILVSIERNATNYNFVFGPHTSSIVKTSVQTESNHFWTDGGPLSIDNDWENLRDDIALT